MIRTSSDREIVSRERIGRTMELEDIFYLHDIWVTVHLCRDDQWSREGIPVDRIIPRKIITEFAWYGSSRKCDIPWSIDEIAIETHDIPSRSDETRIGLIHLCENSYECIGSRRARFIDLISEQKSIRKSWFKIKSCDRVKKWYIPESIVNRETSCRGTVYDTRDLLTLDIEDRDMLEPGTDTVMIADIPDISSSGITAIAVSYSSDRRSGSITGTTDYLSGTSIGCHTAIPKCLTRCVTRSIETSGRIDRATDRSILICTDEGSMEWRKVPKKWSNQNTQNHQKRCESHRDKIIFIRSLTPLFYPSHIECKVLFTFSKVCITYLWY